MPAFLSSSGKSKRPCGIHVGPVAIQGVAFQQLLARRKAPGNLENLGQMLLPLRQGINLRVHALPAGDIKGVEVLAVFLLHEGLELSRQLQTSTLVQLGFRIAVKSDLQIIPGGHTAGSSFTRSLRLAGNVGFWVVHHLLLSSGPDAFHRPTVWSQTGPFRPDIDPVSRKTVLRDSGKSERL